MSTPVVLVFYSLSLSHECRMLSRRHRCTLPTNFMPMRLLALRRTRTACVRCAFHASINQSQSICTAGRREHFGCCVASACTRRHANSRSSRCRRRAYITICSRAARRRLTSRYNLHLSLSHFVSHGNPFKNECIVSNKKNRNKGEKVLRKNFM